jgi:hypothetical protein
MSFRINILIWLCSPYVLDTCFLLCRSPWPSLRYILNVTGVQYVFRSNMPIRKTENSNSRSLCLSFFSFGMPCTTFVHYLNPAMERAHCTDMPESERVTTASVAVTLCLSKGCPRLMLQSHGHDPRSLLGRRRNERMRSRRGCSPFHVELPHRQAPLPSHFMIPS